MVASAGADDLPAEVAEFVVPSRIYSRRDVLARPSPVPAEAGVYGWWFRPLPFIDARGCRQHDGQSLLYVGISPDKPKTGRVPSSENIRKRLVYHYAGNAEGSTLRKTLGCLLAEDLGIQLRRVGSGKRMTFAQGEQVLSAWMAENAYVSWTIRDSPWELEDSLIATLSLPLNLQGNKRNHFHSILTATRARCVAQARALPILTNQGVGGR